MPRFQNESSRKTFHMEMCFCSFPHYVAYIKGYSYLHCLQYNYLRYCDTDIYITYTLSNRALWLATRPGKMELFCPLGTSRRVPHAKLPESHIINPLLTKLIRPRWLDIGFVLFWECMDLEYVSVNKHAERELNLANIQPSWPNKLG